MTFLSLKNRIFNMCFQDTKATEILILHSGLHVTTLWYDIGYLMSLVHTNIWITPWSRHGPILRICTGFVAAILTRKPKQFLISHKLDHGRALLGMEGLSTVWLNIFGVHQALHHAIGEACIAQVLKTGELLELGIRSWNLHKGFAFLKFEIMVKLNLKY